MPIRQCPNGHPVHDVSAAYCPQCGAPLAGEPTSASPVASTRETQSGTIRARDETGDLLPGDVVNIWNDYQTRARVVARAVDGEPVEIVRRSGDGVLVRLGSGVKGWVSYWFVDMT